MEDCFRARDGLSPLQRSVVFAFDADGHHRMCGDEGQLKHQAARLIHFAVQRGGSYFRLLYPPWQMRRAGDEADQSYRHAGTSAAHGEERARPAVAAELHADAKDKYAGDHRRADRRQGAAQGLAKTLPLARRGANTRLAAASIINCARTPEPRPSTSRRR